MKLNTDGSSMDSGSGPVCSEIAPMRPLLQSASLPYWVKGPSAMLCLKLFSVFRRILIAADMSSATQVLWETQSIRTGSITIPVFKSSITSRKWSTGWSCISQEKPINPQISLPSWKPCGLCHDYNSSSLPQNIKIACEKDRKGGIYSTEKLLWLFFFSFLLVV